MKLKLNITMKFKLVFQTFLLYLIMIDIGCTEIQIEITHGINSKQPIGIVPFKENRSDVFSENMSSIITADLCNTGRFNVLSEHLLPQKFIDSSEIISNRWVQLGINIVLVGKIENMNDDNYLIAYELNNIVEQKRYVLLHNQFKIHKKWLRHAAHVISNEIFEKLTGIKGIFCTRIAYVIHLFNHNKHSYTLWISDYDGNNALPVYSSAEPLMSPSWSPNGDQLVYVNFINNHAVLMLHTLSNGTIQKIVDFPRHNGAPAFSPDGTKLAFALSKTGSLNIYIMDLLSKKINQITDNKHNNTEPNWFPDNNNLVYTSDQGGSPQIYKININQRQQEQRLSWFGCSNQNAVVSKNGKFLILVNKDNGQNIAKLNLITGEMNKLTNTFLDETPSISPNDMMLIYSTVQDSHYLLNLISTDGKFKARFPIFTHGEVRFPAWSPYL